MNSSIEAHQGEQKVIAFDTAVEGAKLGTSADVLLGVLPEVIQSSALIFIKPEATVLNLNDRKAVLALASKFDKHRSGNEPVCLTESEIVLFARQLGVELGVDLGPYKEPTVRKVDET